MNLIKIALPQLGKWHEVPKGNDYVGEIIRFFGLRPQNDIKNGSLAPRNDSTVIASANDSECAAIQKNSYRNDWIASSDLRPPRNDGTTVP
ncbi:hypothetical protein IJ541_11340 [bacterium]|nr:hypothetical protein [bacterium]